jgi:hypothetical protein
VQFHQRQRPGVLRPGSVQHHALGLHAGGAEGGQDVGRQQVVEPQAGIVKLHAKVRGHARRPVMAAKVVGHRADGVGRAVEQIDAAVVVKVHGVAHPAGRHELAQAHGARVAAARLEGVDVAAVGQAQKLLQLAAKERGALGRARVGGGEVKGQRGQRIHHPEGAHLLAVEGLHADDAHDDVGGHAVLALGALQRGLVLLPKAQARADAHRFDEAAAVRAPVLGRALGGRKHELGHLGQKPRLANGLAHPFAVQVAARGQVVGKLQGLGAGGVVHHLGGRGF